MNRSWVSALICTSATWVNPGRSELPDPGNVPLEVWAAWHLRADVLLAHCLGRGVECRRDGQLGVDAPAAGEPTELLHRPPHRGLHQAGQLPDSTDPDSLAVTLLATLQGGLLLVQVQRDTRPWKRRSAPSARPDVLASSATPAP